MPTSTFAVDIPAAGRVELIDRVIPDPGPGQVLLRVLGCGFCGGDIERYAGRADFSGPFQLGHEAYGVIEQMGPALQLANENYPFEIGVPGVAVGDTVTGWVVGGAMAGYVIAEARNLRPVPNVGLEHPEVHGEPLMCVVNTVRKAPLELGDDVVVVGAGFMALVTAKLAAMRAGRVIVAARKPEALERAFEWGATDVIDVSRVDIADEVRAITGGTLAHVVYEVTGVQEGLDLAWAAAGRNAAVVGEGFHQHGTRTVDLGQQAIQGQQFSSAHYRPLEDIWAGLDQGLRLVSAGRVDLDPLVTHSVGIHDVRMAFAEALERPPGFVKATVKVEQPPV